MRKNNNEYLVGRSFGTEITMKDPLSDVSMKVTRNVSAVIMQSINWSYDLLSKVLPFSECLAAPVIRFHTKEKEQSTTDCKYIATIPHYLSRQHNLLLVKVRIGNLKHPHLMKEILQGNPHNQRLPCYEVDKKFITIYANHFCDVVCSSTQKICTSKILAIPFGLIDTVGSENQPCMKVKVFLCNYLYSNKNLKQASADSNRRYYLDIEFLPPVYEVWWKVIVWHVSVSSQGVP